MTPRCCWCSGPVPDRTAPSGLPQLVQVPSRGYVRAQAPALLSGLVRAAGEVDQLERVAAEVVQLGRDRRRSTRACGWANGPSRPGRFPPASQATLRRDTSRPTLAWVADRESTGIRRGLQIALGGLWLLDAALQYQLSMFTRTFPAMMLAPAGWASPRSCPARCWPHPG